MIVITFLTSIHPIKIMKQYKQVKEFHQAFGHPVGETPTFMDKERAKSRAQWMVEEYQHKRSDREGQSVKTLHWNVRHSYVPQAWQSIVPPPTTGEKGNLVSETEPISG